MRKILKKILPDSLLSSPQDSIDKQPVVMCSCGILPEHGANIPECSIVARAAGFMVSSHGFILDTKNHRFFDGSNWIDD